MDPFAALGLDACTCRSAEEVNSAFRRLALRFHPDKQRGCLGGDADASADEFRRISTARDRALKLLAERDGCSTLGDLLSMLRTSASVFAGAAAAKAQQRTATKAPTQTPSSQTSPKDPDASDASDASGQAPQASAEPGPVDWAVYVANRLVSCTRARTLQMDLDVSLEDIYKGSTKRLGISVLRAVQPGPFSRVRQEIIVPLSGDALEHRFDGVGDDAPAAMMGILSGAEAVRRRGDVVVRIRPLPHDVFSVDQIISPLDLQATLHVSLLHHYLGGKLALRHLSGETLEVEYEGCCCSSDGERDGGDGQYRQVKVYKGYGLPDSTRSVRGDLYVFLVLRLPKLSADDARDEGVRAALERLSAA